MNISKEYVKVIILNNQIMIFNYDLQNTFILKYIFYICTIIFMKKIIKVKIIKILLNK